MIDLDNNATTRLHPCVAERMGEAIAEGLANPASQHAIGRKSKRRLEEAREQILASVGGRSTGRDADRLIFTSGGTEANNLAMFGLALRGRVAERPAAGAARRVLISAIEHPSVSETAGELARRGVAVGRLPVDRHGRIELDHLMGVLDPQVCLVAVMLGNNETGVLQPIAQVSQACGNFAVPVHCDAIQCVGKIEVDLHRLGVTTLSLSAHKLHGPRGIGALAIRGGYDLRPLLWGGSQQNGLRPGTEPVELAIGMAAACELWEREHDNRTRRLARLRDRLEHGLRSRLPEIVVHAERAERLPHTSSIAFPGFDRQALLMALDLAGVACSTGSACASGSSEPSPVLLAMGLPRELVESTLRFSIGALTTEADIDAAINVIVRVTAPDVG